MDKKYSDFIGKLLTDMETFLISTLSEIELHTTAEENRKELLKQIEMLRQKMSPASEEYIEMNGNIPIKDITVTDTVEEHVNEYMNEDAQPSKNCTVSSETCNEYENQNVFQPEERLGWSQSTAEEASPLCQINPPSAPALKAMAIKYGPLQRKDRFMFMDQFRRFWVALYGCQLYFYTNDRDNKPQHLLDISDYTARHAPEATRDSKKKPLCFEMVCPGNKTQQFIARTPKDMEQWIAVITRVSQKKSSDYILSGERNSTYDDAADTKSKSQKSQRELTHTRYVSDDSDDAIYHDIQDGMIPENLYDDAVGPRGTYSSYEDETYDDVGAWREKVEEIAEAADTEERVGITVAGADETGGTINGIRLPAGGRIRQLVRLMEEEGVIKGDECGRRRDEGGGKITEEGKDH